MNYFVIADTHFGHDKMVTKGYRPEGYEKKILQNIKRFVTPQDVLIHLGDHAFYDVEKWTLSLRESCKGKMWLIRGNHDRKSDTWYLSKGFDFVAETMRIDKFGLKIFFTHEPIKYFPIHSIEYKDCVNVHGHMHNKERSHRYKEYDLNKGHLLVSCEENNYSPVLLRKIVGK